jgi:hypothetical protein
MKKAIFLILIAFVIAGVGTWSFVRRDTAVALKSQQQDELKSELQALTDFKTWLVAQRTLADPFSTRAFLSRDMIDGILTAFDGTNLKLPEVQDVNLAVTHVRTDFRPGFPGLSIEATAEQSGVKADVSAVARIEPVFDNGVLHFHVHVDSLVPRVSWRFIDFTLGGLVRDLAQTKVVDAINKADALGEVSIPLSHTQVFSLPTTQIPFQTTGVNAVVTLPALSGSVDAQLTRIVAMPEGIYVYASLRVLPRSFFLISMHYREYVSRYPVPERIKTNDFNAAANPEGR